jgi:hypothetical protein
MIDLIKEFSKKNVTCDEIDSVLQMVKISGSVFILSTILLIIHMILPNLMIVDSVVGKIDIFNILFVFVAMLYIFILLVNYKALDWSLFFCSLKIYVKNNKLSSIKNEDFDLRSLLLENRESIAETPHS